MATQAQRLAGRFKAHRAALLTLARRIPESAAGFKPWEGGMSLRGQLLHIAGAAEFFLAPALKREALKLPQCETLADAIQALEELSEAEAAQIAALTDEQLAEKVTNEVLKLTLPVGDMIAVMIEHEVHHKGQVFLYARMQGVETPFWVAR